MFTSNRRRRTCMPKENRGQFCWRCKHDAAANTFAREICTGVSIISLEILSPFLSDWHLEPDTTTCNRFQVVKYGVALTDAASATVSSLIEQPKNLPWKILLETHRNRQLGAGASVGRWKIIDGIHEWTPHAWCVLAQMQLAFVDSN